MKEYKFQVVVAKHGRGIFIQKLSLVLDHEVPTYSDIEAFEKDHTNQEYRCTVLGMFLVSSVEKNVTKLVCPKCGGTTFTYEGGTRYAMYMAGGGDPGGHNCYRCTKCGEYTSVERESKAAKNPAREVFLNKDGKEVS